MKKLISCILVLTLCFACTSAMAAGKLSVTQENFHFIPSFLNYGYAYAKVENVGDKPIKVNAGVLEIYDASGDVLTSADYINAFARYLQPGEYTYVCISEDIEEGQVAADYMLTLTGKSENDALCQRLPVTTDLQLNVTNGWWTYNYMYATVTNNTDETLFDIEVVLALLDAEGNILHIDNDSLYSDRGLTPGSSIVIRKDISSSVIDYLSANNLTPNCVDAIAFVEIDLD